MKYIVTINDKNYEVEVERGKANIVRTTQTVELPLAAPAPTLPAAPVLPAAHQVQTDTVAGELLKAPMPGIIVSVNVQSGAAVKKGQVLVILEAMKMESEIVAPRDAVVSQIIVAKGASVSTGDILLALQQ
ncbi:MAG TPA: biotin/lipoyl-binding protein [Syntrophomonadaceae bacterium]|nr:biotin/lipoyl-binding protein [Syntrophomonadaceae bacterium]HNX29577.1 biotin/lipoyl-binding protein [Syntrophomonadaceae bacterium]HPR94228.1 biotin/lipoyl-binding protein [Syntrophomonadaceae bacterium]